MQNILDLLLARSYEYSACSVFADWLPVWRTEQARHAKNSPFAAAIAAALRSDRLAWAFFSGYQAAIQSAFPDSAKPASVNAFCVHESGRKITEISTVLNEHLGALLLRGSKSWVLADVDDLTLYVLARVSSGPPKGPGSLAVVRLPLQTAGVARGLPRPQGTVPELSHVEVSFNAVSLLQTQIVFGDGYADHTKPFRVREDVFVTSCALAYLLSEARSASWPTSWCQRCVAAISALYSCSILDLQDARTHIFAAGILSFASDVIQEIDQHWQSHQATAHDRWRRDRSLLALGKEARRQRAINSWDGIAWGQDKARRECSSDGS